MGRILKRHLESLGCVCIHTYIYIYIHIYIHIYITYRPLTLINIDRNRYSKHIPNPLKYDEKCSESDILGDLGMTL